MLTAEALGTAPPQSRRAEWRVSGWLPPTGERRAGEGGERRVLAGERGRVCLVAPLPPPSTETSLSPRGGRRRFHSGPGALLGEKQRGVRAVSQAVQSTWPRNVKRRLVCMHLTFCHLNTQFTFQHLASPTHVAKRGRRRVKKETLQSVFDYVRLDYSRMRL